MKTLKNLYPLLAAFIFLIQACATGSGSSCPCINGCPPVGGTCDLKDPYVTDLLDKCDHNPGINDTEITESSGYRLIETNGIPNHGIGIFGNLTVGPCGRPNHFLAPKKKETYKIPLDPGITEHGKKSYEFFEPPVIFGIAINGIVLDPEAAEYYLCRPCIGWQKSALNHPDMEYDLDCNNGHVQPDGTYHYHGLPVGLYTERGGYVHTSGHTRPLRITPVLLGWGKDGVPVYGPHCLSEENKDGSDPLLPNYWTPASEWVVTIPGTTVCVPPDAGMGYYDEDYKYGAGKGLLDPCNGHFGPTPENLDGEYHYHILEEYPHIPRCHTAMD